MSNYRFEKYLLQKQECQIFFTLIYCVIYHFSAKLEMKILLAMRLFGI